MLGSPGHAQRAIDRLREGRPVVLDIDAPPARRLVAEVRGRLWGNVNDEEARLKAELDGVETEKAELQADLEQAQANLVRATDRGTRTRGAHAADVRRRSQAFVWILLGAAVVAGIVLIAWVVIS